MFSFFKSNSASFTLLGVTLSFLIFANTWVDPDFGWHFRLGEIILKSGIPKTEPFSFTMPSYPLINLEWLAEVVYYHLYQALGYSSLAILHGALALLSIIFVLYPSKKKYWTIPLLLVASSLITRLGVRPQVIGWFFLSIFLFITSTQKNWISYRLLLPILMAFWANTHGSFLLGLILLFINIVDRQIRQKKVAAGDLIVLFASIVSTFINPYGIKAWLEVLHQMSENSLHRITLGEWKSSIFGFNLAYFALLSFTSSLMWLNRKQLTLWEMAVLFGSTIAGVMSGRHVPLSSLLIAPLFIKHYESFRQLSLKLPYGKGRFIIFERILIVICIAIFVLSVYSSTFLPKNFNISTSSFYPVKASEFIKNQYDIKHVYADYNIGGYLIWAAPEKKYFSYGIMAAFTWDAPENESNYAYKEHLDILCGDIKIQDVIKKYNIDTALVQKAGNKQNKSVLNWSINMQKKLGLVYCEHVVNLKAAFEEINWEIVYEDEKFVVYRPTS